MSPRYGIVDEEMEARIRTRIKEYYLPGTGTKNNSVGSSNQSTDRTTAERPYNTLLLASKQERNSFISELVAYSDMRFKEWKVTLKTMIDIKSNAFGAAAIALSAGGSLTPTPLSNILSGGSAALQGIDKLLSSVVLSGNTIEAITNAIEIARKRQLALIEINKSKEVADYTVADGFRDAVAYDSLITLDVGINELSAVASKKLSEESTIYAAVAGANTYQEKLKALDRAKKDLAKAAADIDTAEATLDKATKDKDAADKTTLDKATEGAK